MTIGVDFCKLASVCTGVTGSPATTHLPLALIVIDHGRDPDAAVLADARQPLPFRRGANDRQPVQIGDIESAMRRHSVAQAWQTAAVEAGQPMRIGARC